MPTDPIQLALKTVTGKTGDGPHLLITAGVHGDEFEPMAAVRCLIKTLEASRLKGRVTLVPVVNQPAFLRGARVAEDGLDLARTCPGRSDGSITERIALSLSHLIRSADYYVDLHTGGALFDLVPLTGYVLHAEPKILEVQRRMAMAFNLPLVWGTTPTLEGRSLSVARDASIPAIYVEHGGGGPCDPAKVEDLIVGCRNVMAELSMYGQPHCSTSRVRHIIHDARPSSGHMQINHPSPAAGFFEPGVKAGDMIKSGQPLGEVVDVLGDAPTSVAATNSGIVAVLRSARSVNKGDSLATIIEVDDER